MHSDGAIVFKTKIDNSDVQKDLNRVKRDIEKSQKTIAESEAAKLPLLKDAEQLKNKLQEARQALAFYKEEQAAAQAAMQPGSSLQDYMAANERLPAINAAVGEQQRKVDGLEKEWAQVNSKITQYNQQISQAHGALAAQQAKAGELSTQLAKGGHGMAVAMTKAQASAKKFQMRLAGILSQVFVFSLIYKALRAITQYMGKALKSNKEFTAELARLKGALLTAFQPLYETLLPALLSLMRVATNVIQAVAHIASLLGGKSASQYADSAKALNEEAKAVEGVGEAAKKAKRDLAGFDEINTLGGNKEDDASSTETTPSFSDFSTDEYKQKIDEVAVLASGALLAIGVILAFSGANIPLGIGLMAAGAIGLATEASTNWQAMQDALQGPVGQIMAIASGALLVLGMILAFSGAAVPLGIALMATGAAGLGITAAANWNSLVESMQYPVNEIGLIASSALLVLGMILAFSGAALPLGIGLIVAGAAGLATVATLNWNTVADKLEGPVGETVAATSAVLLALGMILAFSGAALPLGIGLIVVGAAGLAATVTANWSTVKEKIQEQTGLIMAISSLLFTVGLILAFSGAGIPLGIGLMAAGAAGLGTAAAVSWDTVKKEIDSQIGLILAISSLLFVAGMVLALTGAALPLGIGLMIAGAGGLAASATISWDSMKKKIEEQTGLIVGISSLLLVIGLVLCFTGAALPLGIGLIVAGATGLGTAAAVNWNSIVSALQGPIGGVVAIASAALLALGIILVCTGVGIPLGIALIAAGAAGLVTVTALNWGSIQGKIQEVWKGIKQWWNTTVAPIFTKEYWREKFAKMVEALPESWKDAINRVIAVVNNFIGWVNNKLHLKWDAFKIAGIQITPAVDYQLFSIPNIPYLAQGAVIPPNAPFMAMLGDQRHGTNVEAPLTTIQEAVAIVMEDMIQSNIAGHEATVAVLQQILEAVYGIDTSDGKYARAVERYQQKMAIVRGG